MVFPAYPGACPGCKRPAAGQMLRRKGGRGSSSMYDAVGYTFFGLHNMGGQLRLKVAKDVGVNPLVYDDELVRTVDNVLSCVFRTVMTLLWPFVHLRPVGLLLLDAFHMYGPM